MAKKEKLKPEEVVAALNASEGLVYVAAERLACSAQTVYNYANRYAAVKEAMNHQKGKRLDTAEASLWRAVLSGEGWAVCFYLKTQGKERGYVERQEHDHRGGLVVELIEEVVRSPEVNGEPAKLEGFP